MEKNVQDLKQIRADMDLLLFLSRELPGSRENSLAFTKLQEGKMHIGNALKELQCTEVYASSKDPKDNVIDKYHIDKEITQMATPGDWFGSEIAKFKIMRRELELIIERLKKYINEHDYMLTLSSEGMFGAFYVTESIVRVKESVNWYGMVLGNIRDGKGTLPASLPLALQLTPRA